MRIAAAILLALLLVACGNRAELKPQAGKELPVAPAGAKEKPGPDKLLTPDDQARPERSDEILKRSEDRKPDEFDLPPG